MSWGVSSSSWELGCWRTMRLETPHSSSLSCSVSLSPCWLGGSSWSASWLLWESKWKKRLEIQVCMGQKGPHQCRSYTQLFSTHKRGKRPPGCIRHGTTMVHGNRKALMSLGVFGFTSPAAKLYQVNHAFTNTLTPNIYIGNRITYLITPVFIIFCRMIYTPVYSAECFMQLTVICLTLVFLHLIASNFFHGFKECI